MSSLPKPELRGYLRRYITRAVIGSFIFAGVNCGLFYYFYMEPRKKAFAEYERTYNAEEHFKILKKYGYLQSTSRNS